VEQKEIALTNLLYHPFDPTHQVFLKYYLHRHQAIDYY